MSTAIAFLSGKGGSGKTTLALGIADLMRRCEIRTLLVDCDLCTNGATYFYGGYLPVWKDRVACSFYDVLSLDAWEDVPDPIPIDPYLDFFPSISSMSGRYLKESSSINIYSRQKVRGLLHWARENYEVILIDCQAGYTRLLQEILPMMDVSLFVLEPDSISGSAMSSLHLKIGNIEGTKLYQIFNKATPEEFGIYSKIVGTFFTNIGTLMFDWKIRQAFSRSQIPDLENISIQYGEDLCNICKIMFMEKKIQEKLYDFGNKLTYQKLKEEYKLIEEERANLMDRPSKSKKWLIVIFSIMTLMLGFTSYWLSGATVIAKNGFLLFLVFFSVAILATLISAISYSLDVLRETKREKEKYNRKLYDISQRMRDIQKEGSERNAYEGEIR